jgi:hypothetical protein
MLSPRERFWLGLGRLQMSVALLNSPRLEVAGGSGSNCEAHARAHPQSFNAIGLSIKVTKTKKSLLSGPARSLSLRI